jgi:UDP-glucuronate decarboxylase
MTKQLLLTGGTGFFGRALLRQHLARDEEGRFPIVVLSRNPERFQATYPELSSCSGLRYLKGDIENRASLPWGESFSHVLHAATDSTLGPSLTPLQRFQQILQGTTNILDLAVATGVRRFLLTSSGGIYGPQPSDLEAIPEDWTGTPPLAEPATAYSQAKRAAEHLCALYREAHGIETVIARCFAFVGPDLPLNAHFAIGNFIQDALTSEYITVAGDGTPIRTYLDQSDLAHWLWTLMNDGLDGETYNVGSDQPISILELAHLVRDLLAPSKEVCILGSSNSASARSLYVPSIIKVEALHKLSPRVTLDQAICNTAYVYRQG